MAETKFDSSLADSQGTAVRPLSPDKFDIDRYADYAAGLDEKCKKFWAAGEGVLVCRRFRVPEVFAGACRDMAQSLSLQLGALTASMDYAMDVPNFLEPWYGIGAVPAAYGAQYVWNGNAAPATKPLFENIEDAVAAEPKPIEKTEIGKHIREMIEYFLDKTKGKIPISLSDVQSPLDSAVALVDTSEFYASCVEEPEQARKLIEKTTELQIAFCEKQLDLIGSALALPGHGFSSSRCFKGLGFSDDNSIMLSPDMHLGIAGPSMTRFGEAFGGSVFHSCGNWSARAGKLAKLPGLKMVDGAFTPETDPSPNPTEPFVKAFPRTGICVNARMVGSAETVLETYKKLNAPGMKLIVVTYCKTTEEEKRVYEAIHQ